MRLPTKTNNLRAKFRDRLFASHPWPLVGLLVALSACNGDDGGVNTLGAESGESAGSGTLGADTGSAQAPETEECAEMPNGTACDGGQGYCAGELCTPHRCGDAVRSAAEACDDGNTIGGDGCSADCQLETVCGNGIKEATEGCDEGPSNGQPGSICASNCQLVPSVCGNGVREGAEQCDDGNRIGRDGCSTLCTLEHCGNRIVDAFEQCDDGNLVDGDGCSSLCTTERCGDNLIQFGRNEQCDDGNVQDGDGCSSTCTLETTCGNRRVEPPNETCDDGNNESGDGCSADCKLESGYCGDGIAQAMETCDDGNVVDGDGCSANCERESDVVPACNPLESQKLPARSIVLNKTAPPAQFVYTSELFGRYRALCGACHVDTDQGGFQTEAGTMSQVAAGFAGKKDQILDSMFTDDPFDIMPPGAKPMDELGESAPTVVLASQLQAWYEQGLSTEGFYWEGSAVPAHAGYAIDEELSGKLTNIGSCEPTKDLLHHNQHQSQRLDAFFAKTDHWPKLLSETDFTSMDSLELARAGVISYATTYQLWADNAKKMRHFKLPYGKKIRFDQEKQLFVLLENTRIYKTFLKEVKDRDGNISYRKMETRVILVRQDEIAEDGTAKVRALYGSYKWNADETQAVLVDTPLRNGEPFADDIFMYDTDEKAAHEARTTPSKSNVALSLLSANKVRHYVIPGSQRCDECHLGSLEENFVVGFSPLQLNRRANGEGGVIDKVYPGELGQLQRFIDWGLFENFTDTKLVKPLEAEQSPSYWSGKDAVSPEQAMKNQLANEQDPEAAALPETEVLSGARKFRNQSELEMQGYMLGNCAHCHNPRGYPSVREPALSQRLNMHPLTEGGGIFEFRLDNLSPRNERGGDLRIPVPYITPSITDVRDFENGSDTDSVIDFGFESSGPRAGEPAPWRSLIYRNVDTPYTYVFHKTIYPHMPVHTPGYDCRIRDLTAKWMLSIPSVLKDPLSPDPAPKDPSFYIDKFSELYPNQTPLDEKQAKALVYRAKANPQPWKEVHQGDPAFAQAQEAAQARVNDFLSSGRSSAVCQGLPETEFDDSGNPLPPAPNVEIKNSIEAKNIIAASVFSGDRTEPYTDTRNGLVAEPHMGAYDMTEIPPPWWPRRADWASALKIRALEGASDEAMLVNEVLENLRLDDDIKALAMQEIPLGFWQEKKQCSFSNDPTIATLPKDQRWHWMSEVDDKDQKRPLYYERTGAIIFKSVCAQCHGRKGDSQGAMANTLSELTGGESRVANFDSGMFGPADNRGKHLKDIFGAEATAQGMSVDDLAAQYMTWMSLGGTRSRIHSAVLNVVNSTGLLGMARPGLQEATDGNMLNVAKDICGAMLARTSTEVGKNKKSIKYNLLRKLPIELRPEDKVRTVTFPVIDELADAELWFKICTFNNPMPIAILGPVVNSAVAPPIWRTTASDNENTELALSVGPGNLRSTMGGFVKREFGMGQPMMNHDGGGTNFRVETMTDATRFPSCVRRTLPRFQEKVNKVMSNAKVDGKAVPFCPESWSEWDLDGYTLSDKVKNKSVVPQMMSEQDIQRWVMRGAANAGLIVYTFTQALISGEASLAVDYNRCEDRQPAKK